MGPIPHLPYLSLKCTSMIMDTANFSIDYSPPFIPNVFKSPYNTAVEKGTLKLNAPPNRTPSSNSEDQGSQSTYKSDKPRAPALCRHPNVHITMQYIGTGFPVTNEIINPKDELAMLQQICGGENICIYKGYLSPGETFQFVSKRHYGFPFSASVYINGLISARISACCEYRYHVGFQQGRRGCFRIIHLAGGRPCYRCIDFHNRKRFQIKPEMDHISGKEFRDPDEHDFRGDPLMQWAQASGCLRRNDPGNEKQDTTVLSRTTERPPGGQERHETSQHKQRNLRDIQVFTANQRRRLKKKKRRPPKVESDSEQENIQHNKEDRGGRKSKTRQPGMRVRLDVPIQFKLVSALSGAACPCCEVELSDSSDSSESRSIAALRTEDPPTEDTDDSQNTELVTDPKNATQSPREEEEEESITESRSVEDCLDTSRGEEEENALLNQISDLISVLLECDEVSELVLRNTGMTDVLLQRLTDAIMHSSSQVENINLNLNELGPHGAEMIARLLQEKPCVRSLLLHGNQFGDEGVIALLNGLSMLYINWRETTILNMSASKHVELCELDIGGNQLSSDGLRSVASFLRLNPPLKSLGLAQSTINSAEAWKDVFDTLKVNTNITHILLDENNLGDSGARFLADALQVNRSLASVDLDSNDIGEGGGQAIAESLIANAGSRVKCVSLDDNPISKETLDRIQTLLSLNSSK
ncbi:uncharacterized protein RCH25_004756 [Pelodytes ibericus]